MRGWDRARWCLAARRVVEAVGGCPGRDSLRPVQVSLLGTTLLYLGSLTPAYLPQVSPYWPVMRARGLDAWWAKAAGTGLVVAAVATPHGAWFSLRPTIYHDVKHWAVLRGGRCLSCSRPIFSHDAYAYAAYGWLIHNRLNPYEVARVGCPAPSQTRLTGCGATRPPPMGRWHQIGHGLVDLAGFNLLLGSSDAHPRAPWGRPDRPLPSPSGPSR